MRYEIKRKERLADGLHRVVRQEFNEVAARVRSLRATGEKREAIHDTRRHLKRLRALCQLWREPVGADLCSRETAILRDVGRNLSAVRDLEVRLTLFDDLMRDGHANAEVQRIKLQWTLEHRRRQRLACRPIAVARLIQRLNDARRGFAACSIHDVDWPVMAHALCRAYRRARKVLNATKERDSSSDALHEWRKRAKVLEYQLSLLRRAHRGARHMAERLNELTDCLGDEHDLVILETILHEHFANYLESASGGELLAAIAKRRARLIKCSRALGRQLFKATTEEFVEQLKRWRCVA